MSVKQGLLALLAEEPMYGARLRSEFEARTGGTWPLNVGQVYTTLARLERDGLVEPVGGSDDEGRIAYRLTAAGRSEIESWWLTPVDRDSTPRDELVIKLALAVTSPGVDVPRVVQTQRTATLKHLRDLTRLKSRASDEPDARDLAWLLVLENLLFAAEAEVRWLDHVESTLSRMPAAALRSTGAVGAAAEHDAPRARAASKGGRS
ncbi:DNA-binding PadR family transcriptional regulator [Humibacillus xanthopallidus]|uniref:DNA-binding PadR family transcriptional regulator n=1 Tax=Humibacillus xanthopallidus TaxID=412689 RepID=A0A543PPV4_9MICO|nr:PadR family transcriptional regulator [Humibacillus xanthopallidus]TQN46077.1 DNA-binding PadR family transcriptional regulator [Humibacillus xanthopallidus]